MDLIIVSFLTALVTAIVTSILTHREIKRRAELDLRNEYETRYNQNRWSTYTMFVEASRDLIIATYDEPKVKKEYRNRTKVENELFAIASDLLLIGSDSVVRAFRDWRGIYTVNGPLDSVSLQRQFVIITEMRKDLGIYNTNLDLDDMLGSLVPGYHRAM